MENTKCKFKIGDKVKVVNIGLTYSSFEAKFRILGFKDMRRNPSWFNGEVGEVWAFTVSPRGGYMVALNHADGRQCLIHEEGVQLALPEKWAVSEGGEDPVLTQEELGNVYLKIEGLDKGRFIRLVGRHHLVSERAMIAELEEDYRYIENCDYGDFWKWVSTNNLDNGAELITLDELENRLNGGIQEVEKVELTISREALGEVYPLVCEGWQSRIEALLDTNKFGDEFTVPQELLTKARDVYDNVKQKEWLDKYFPEPEEPTIELVYCLQTTGRWLNGGKWEVATGTNLTKLHKTTHKGKVYDVIISDNCVYLGHWNNGKVS